MNVARSQRPSACQRECEDPSTCPRRIFCADSPDDTTSRGAGPSGPGRLPVFWITVAAALLALCVAIKAGWL